MHEAYWRAAGCDTDWLPPSTPECYAAELRAIADAIKAHPEADRCIEWSDVADWICAEADRTEKEK